VKTVIILLVATLLSVSTGGICCADDIQKGFGGLQWADPLDQVDACEGIDNRGAIQYCTRKDRIHTLMGEIGPNVIYGFYQGAFFAVFIQIEDDDIYDQTKSRLMNLLGAPGKSLNKEGDLAAFRWTQGRIRIELSNDQSNQGFRLAYYYIPLAEKVFRMSKSLYPSKWPKLERYPKETQDELDQVGILQF